MRNGYCRASQVGDRAHDVVAVRLPQTQPPLRAPATQLPGLPRTCRGPVLLQAPRPPHHVGHGLRTDSNQGSRRADKRIDCVPGCRTKEVELPLAAGLVEPVDHLEGIPTGCCEASINGKQVNTKDRFERDCPEALTLPVQFRDVGLPLMPVGPEPQIHLASTVVREGTSACSKGIQLLLTQLLCTCVLLLPTHVSLLKDVGES